MEGERRVRRGWGRWIMTYLARKICFNAENFDRLGEGVEVVIKVSLHRELDERFGQAIQILGIWTG